MEKIFKEKYKTIITDVLFLIGGGICLLVRYKIDSATFKNSAIIPFHIISMIIVIYIFPLKINDNKKIYENKGALISALIIIAIGKISFYILNYVYGLNNGTVNHSTKFILFVLLLQLGVTLTLFISYFLKIKFTEFNWNISIKSFVLVLLAFIIYLVVSRGDAVFNININLKLLINFIHETLYPGIYEELLFRGLLISGLKSCGFSDDKCNVVQAVIFGLVHTGNFGIYSWISLLSTANQAMMGYVFGKVYFKTKSLTPCILLHGFVDAI